MNYFTKEVLVPILAAIFAAIAAIFVTLWLQKPEVRLPSGLRQITPNSIFQEFKGVVAIDELWADPLAVIDFNAQRPAMIRAEVTEDESRNRYLKLIYDRQGQGVNVTLRQQDQNCIDISKFNRFRITIRSPLSEPQGVRFRVVDENGQIWVYGASTENYIYENLNTIAGGKERNISVELRTNLWSNFVYDGSTGLKSRPGFMEGAGAICLIVLEVGRLASDQDKGSPGYNPNTHLITGQGELWIDNVIFEQ